MEEVQYSGVDETLRWMPLFSAFFSAVVVPAIIGVYRELRRMNGRMISMEQWRMDHERADERRFYQTEKDLDEIKHDVKDLSRSTRT